MRTIDTLGLTSSAACVEDKEGMSALYSHNLMALTLADFRHFFLIINVVAFVNVFLLITVPLNNHTLHLGFACQLARTINVSNIWNDLSRLDTS